MAERGATASRIVQQAPGDVSLSLLLSAAAATLELGEANGDLSSCAHGRCADASTVRLSLDFDRGLLPFADAVAWETTSLRSWGSSRSRARWSGAVGKRPFDLHGGGRRVTLVPTNRGRRRCSRISSPPRRGSGAAPPGFDPASRMRASTHLRSDCAIVDRSPVDRRPPRASGGPPSELVIPRRTPASHMAPRLLRLPA